jgi:hypothetical protein
MAIAFDPNAGSLPASPPTASHSPPTRDLRDIHNLAMAAAPVWGSILSVTSSLLIAKPDWFPFELTVRSDKKKEMVVDMWDQVVKEEWEEEKAAVLAL